MRPLFTVASFTFKEMAKRKSFIISNIIILLIIIIGFNIPNLMKTFSGEEVLEGATILVTDSSDIFEGRLNSLNDINLGYKFQINNNITYEEIKGKIDAGEIEAAMVITPKEDTIHIEYLVENIATVSEVPEEFSSAIASIYTNLQLSKLDLTPEQLNNLSGEFEFELAQTSDKEISGNVFAIMLLSLVLFYAIYFCAYQVSTSITTEKTSKIMETLVTSTSPRTIVLGKTIGVGVLGLLQVVVIVAVALICAKSFLEPEMINSVVDVSKFTPFLAVLH